MEKAATHNENDVLKSISDHIRTDFERKNVLISFQKFLELFKKNPQKMSRNSAQYMKDMMEWYGTETYTPPWGGKPHTRYKLFEKVHSGRKKAIVGQELAHEQIHGVLDQFVRQGRIDKLILLHGPNGSSKSSTAEALAAALEEYSQTDEGAVYTFNWVFPNDKAGFEGLVEDGTNKRIGFGSGAHHRDRLEGFSHLKDEEIMCKISSEFRENPLFLIPPSDRVRLFQAASSQDEDNPDLIPRHLREGQLTAKNKQIFDALLLAYNGDFEKVMRHVQVERFTYSSRYRRGVATVEPQMAMDAQEKQLTLERHIQNIPSVLQNIRLFEPSGELVDANRGFIEFSDLLKRPLEAFKYLLTTIEKMNINLNSGIADLDMIMMASANEKHLDAFKASPDWPSFKGRFELVRVPYLLSARLEEQIYAEDLHILSKSKPIGPHTARLLSRWAILTRLRLPDPDSYINPARTLVSKLSPTDKLALYEGEELSEVFAEHEKALLRKHVDDIRRESQSSMAYEGRFGASPREMKMLLYFAAQNPDYDSLSALSIFEELKKLTSDKSVYDYLQFEPRGGYHDAKEFVHLMEKEYAELFRREFMQALNMFDETQYKKAFEHYLRHVLSFLKKEKIENEVTGKMEDPNETSMNEIEVLLEAPSSSKKEFREKIIAKMAAWRVDHPDNDVDITRIYQNELMAISRKIYDGKEEEILRITEGMLKWGNDDYDKQDNRLREACEETFDRLHSRFGYTRKNAWKSLVFLRSHGKPNG